MKKDSLIRDERNYARHLLFVLKKLDYIDEKLVEIQKNKAFLFQDNEITLLDTKRA